MDRDLTIEVVSDTTYFPVFQKYCKGSCYADEHYLPTFVSIEFSARNSNRSITWVDWTRGGPHPLRYIRTDVTEQFLGKLRSEECRYNEDTSNTTNVCYLFARKFLPNALDRLLRFAPKIMHFNSWEDFIIHTYSHNCLHIYWGHIHTQCLNYYISDSYVQY